MYNLLVAVAAVFVSTSGVCEAVCSFSGKDTPVQVDFNEFAKKRWYLLYSSQNQTVPSVDNIYKDYSKVGDYEYRSIATIVMESGFKIHYNFTALYTDGLLREIYDFKDGSGNNAELTSYIVAKTDEGGMLFHQCDAKDGDKPLRSIYVPFGITLSEESLKQLMDADKKFSNLPNYHSLFKLPNRL